VHTSARSLLTPAVALGAAGVVALSPVVVPSPALSARPAPSVPAVHLAEVQLAGIGQDIYNAIQPWVQYAVDTAAYVVGFVPFIGGPIAEQIFINYDDGIQPLVENTVNYLAALIANPLGFLPITAGYLNDQFFVGVNYVSAQLQFIGFPPLPPSVMEILEDGGLIPHVRKQLELEIRN